MSTIINVAVQYSEKYRYFLRAMNIGARVGSRLAIFRQYGTFACNINIFFVSVSTKMTGKLHHAWSVIEAIGRFTCTWPANTNVSKWKIIFRNVYWIYTVINTFLVAASLILGFYFYHSDLVTMIESISEIGCLLELMLDLLFYKLHGAELEILFRKMRTYVETANEYETRVIRSYINRYMKYFVVVTIQYVSTGTLFNLMALFKTRRLPLNGWFPFSMERNEIYYYFYVMEACTVFQISLSIFSDFVIVGLISYIAARLDILGSEMKQVSDYDLLVSRIKEHQELIGFFEDTTAAVQALLFKTNIVMGGTVISAVLSLLYVQNESLLTACQYFGMVTSGCGHMCIITWPADDLKESSLQFARSLGDIPWTGKSRKMKSAVLIMMQRCQKPFLISMGGLLPVLSLQYFSQFLTNIFSYFMAMRSMLEA